MIKFENTEVMNFEGALRGMRNPLNTWDKSDSEFNCDDFYNETCYGCQYKDSGCNPQNGVYLGENDLNLTQRLIKAGSDHRKFLRQIFVSVDITAPLYWWKEFDTYKVATVSNSCSTMHTIHKKEFTLDDFSHDKLIDSWFNDMGNDDSVCFDGEYSYEVKAILEDVMIPVLNECRQRYIETKNKKWWWQIIQLLPTSYNQKRTITLNYETLRNIYGSRRNHKLDEWSKGFMEWIDSLPYAEELIKYEG